MSKINNSFIFTTITLVILQVIIWMFFTFSQLLFIVFLPAIILCLPARVNAIGAMIIAALLGLAVDFLCAAPLGLCSVSLIPIAYFRTNIIRLVFGNEVLVLNEDLSISRYGLGKFVTASFIGTFLFLAIYIFADSFGTRPMWIDFQKFVLSLLVSFPFAVYTSKILCTDTRRR